MKKKALSPIVSIVLIIGLIIASIAIVFTVVKNMSEDKLKESKSCFDILDTMEINSDYTCYNISEEEIRLSLNRKVVSVDYLLVAVSSGNEAKTFKLYDTDTVVDEVIPYDSGSTFVRLPTNESGTSYIIYWGDSAPEKIQIAPSVNGKMCNVLDEILEIPFCN